MKGETPHLFATAIYVICVALDCYFGSSFLKIAGWTFYLPNFDYLYVFAWLPLVTYFAIHFFWGYASDRVKIFTSGILFFSCVTYTVTGVAQLYRAFIFPVGLYTLAISFVFYITARRLLESSSRIKDKKEKYLLISLGSLLTVVASTIFLQPWKVVVNLPDITGVDLSGYNLSGLHLYRVSFNNANLRGVDFSNTELIAPRFFDSDLSYSTFYRSNIDGAEFVRSKLKGASIRKSRIYQTRFESSNLNNVLIKSSFVGRTYIVKSSLCGAKFIDLPFGEGIYSWSDSIYSNTSVFPDGASIEEGNFRASQSECEAITVK